MGRPMSGLVEKVTKLCLSQGFVQQAETIVNNSALTCYNYGPLGTSMRNNFLQQWWQSVVVKQGNIYPVHNTSLPQSDVGAGQSQVTEIDSLSGIEQHYLPTLQMLGHQLPFGLAQIRRGRRTNNEQHDSQYFIARSEEYHELRCQFYAPPSQAAQWMDHLQRHRLDWWKQLASNSSDFQLLDSETSTSDVQEGSVVYRFPWGREELETFRNLGDRLLQRLQSDSGTSHQGQFRKRPVLPHVIEGAAHLETGLWAYLLDAYRENKQAQVMHLHPKLAPFQVGIALHGQPKSQTYLQELADHLAKELRKENIMTLELRESQNTPPQQYAKFDILGIPLCILVNENSLATGIVQVRSRNTTLLEPMPVTRVCDTVKKCMDF